MIERIPCKGCGVERRVDLADFFGSGKKRIVCGICGTVLLTEDQALDIYLYSDYDLYQWGIC